VLFRSPFSISVQPFWKVPQQRKNTPLTILYQRNVPLLNFDPPGWKVSDRNSSNFNIRDGLVVRDPLGAEQVLK